MRPFGVWGKVVFGVRKHNLASTPNNVFRGSPLSALKSFMSLIDLVLSFLILISIHVEQYRKCASTHVSYSFLNSGCKTTIFSWFCRYAKYNSLPNQKRVVRGALLCPVLPIRLTKFNWLPRPSRGFLLRQAAKPSPDKKPNYFFIPPKFAFSLKLKFPIIPCLTFYLRLFCVNLLKSVRSINVFS